METTFLNTSMGWLEIAGSEQGIRSVLFCENPQKDFVVPAPLQKCVIQLEAYFRGELQQFDLKLDPQGSDFQRKVWNELLNIPFAETISYLELAKRIGDVKSVRAVGAANGQNKISIIIPCHRVIGSNGKLVGYAGGLPRKEWLLKHEMSFKAIGLFS